MFRRTRFASPFGTTSTNLSFLLPSSSVSERIINTNPNSHVTSSSDLMLTANGGKVASSCLFCRSLEQESRRFCSSSSSSAPTTYKSATSKEIDANNKTNENKAVLTLAQMELNLRRQLGPQSQLLVREQFTAAGRRNKKKKNQQNKENNSNDQNDNDDNDSEPLSIFRSSVTFRQCGFSITLCTAQSSKNPDEALRLAYNGAVSTDISFFNSTLRPQDAAVFDRVRFLALGLGKMIRFSIGGGGDESLVVVGKNRKAPSRSATTATSTAGKSNIAEEENEMNPQEFEEKFDESVLQQQLDEEEQARDDASIFTCTALMKDDFEVGGRAKDSVVVTMTGRSAQEAFNRAVVATRERLTKETEEGTHALEDVRELQLFLNNQHAEISSKSPSMNDSSSSSSSSSSKKLLHPELFVSNNNNNNRNNNRGRNNNNNNEQSSSTNGGSKNYTAKITVTDSFGNSYYAKSGDFNRTALAAYRSCVNQIYKKESFLSSSTVACELKPAPKSFFAQVQWHVEHLTWHSGLVRSLDWEYHYRSTIRSSFSAATNPNHNNKGGGSKMMMQSSGNSESNHLTPSYLHATLHIGPVELAFADGVGRYRVMLNCYCNALERLLMNAPKRFTHFLPIPSVSALYAQYMEIDRFQPTDSLKGAVKGLNPQTVLGAVLNQHLGSYFQMPIERRESLLLTKMQQQQQQNNNKNNNNNNNNNGNYGNDIASEDVVFVVATLPNQETTLTLSDASTIKPGTKTLILGRTTASRLACSYALKENFPIIYNLVKDRPDFKQGTLEKEHEKKLQKLRSLPREKRIVQYENLLTLLREFGSEDHGWADVDVDCKMRSVGLWVATVYVRMKKDNTTRDIRVSRPTSTKNECRKRVILETAFTYYPQETQVYLQKEHKKEEYSKSDLEAVMGNQIASSIKPYDPVSSGSVVDQMLGILEERARVKIMHSNQNSSSNSSANNTSHDGDLVNDNQVETNNSASSLSNVVMIQDLVGDEDILRVSCEVVTDVPFPKSNSSTSSSSSSSTTTTKFSFFDSEQKDVRYNINIISSPVILSSSSSSPNDENNNNSNQQEQIQEQQLIFRAVSLPGTSLLQAVRETITSATAKLQLDAERIRLLVASFEEYKVPQIFRPQDLAEWMLKANFGLENVKVEVNHSQGMWVGALFVRFPVQECYWPGNDYQRQQLKKNRLHLRLARESSSPFHQRIKKKKFFTLQHQLAQNPINSIHQQILMLRSKNNSHNNNANNSSLSTGGLFGRNSHHNNNNNNHHHHGNNNNTNNNNYNTFDSSLKVYEWVEIARAISPSKRETIKLCYIKAALTNCYAHLQYMAKKSLEQQTDAEEILGCDTEQYHSLLTTEQVSHFLKLSPSPLSVLRSALRNDKLRLLISLDPCEPPAIPLSSINAAAAANNDHSDEKNNNPSMNDSSMSYTSSSSIFSKRFTNSSSKNSVNERTNDLGVSSTASGINNNNNNGEAGSTKTRQEELYFECCLYTVPLFPQTQQYEKPHDESSNNNQKNDIDATSNSPTTTTTKMDEDHQHHQSLTALITANLKLISKQKASTSELALEAAIYSALDELMGDDDLRYWLSRWNLEMLDADAASLEKIGSEIE